MILYYLCWSRAFCDDDYCTAVDTTNGVAYQVQLPCMRVTEVHPHLYHHHHNWTILPSCKQKYLFHSPHNPALTRKLSQPPLITGHTVPSVYIGRTGDGIGCQAPIKPVLTLYVSMDTTALEKHFHQTTSILSDDSLDDLPVEDTSPEQLSSNLPVRVRTYKSGFSTRLTILMLCAGAQVHCQDCSRGSKNNTERVGEP